ncbi:MAG TPA: multicopper oxidase domain-containing protein [Candidatus Binatia bacterium]|nr:multicopper oxidase domain-containing protein [Candidatus Binatia bacterium]
MPARPSMSRPVRRIVRALVVLLPLVMVPAGSAQNGCGSPDMQDLVEPPQLRASDGTLSTTLYVQQRSHACVPVFAGTSWTWAEPPMILRTYGFPATAGSSPIAWSTPGPTLRVRRASTPAAGDGDALKILLVNELPVPAISDTQCDPACLSGNAACCPPAGQPCPESCTQGCPVQTYPECFHGNNSTNLHFHGAHVSPQPPQDYVLLELQPAGTPGVLAGHAHARGQVTSGQYQYAVNPFPWNQAEGTHWYHPHKHGAAAIQVLNGMAGALIVEGPFDDWLNAFYQPQGRLVEKVLVIQQLDEQLNFFNQDPSYAPPQPLVNGQANPVITMAPGEIQRWRFVSATMQGAAQLAVGWETPGAPAVRQIAQDGLVFGPRNYESQPLLAQGLANFALSPGNRADFLVQAPAAPGIHFFTFDVNGHLEGNIKARHDARRAARIAHHQAQAQQLGATATARPPLLTVRVTGPAKPMVFPSTEEWPPLPPFLAEIHESEVVGTRSLLFSMTGGPGGQPNAFFINDKQFDSSCADETMAIGAAEEWTVANNSSPKHPFHIHINPFQIIAINNEPLPRPWLWWDTFGLPPLSTTPRDVGAGRSLAGDDEAQQICPAACTAARATWNGQWSNPAQGRASVCDCLPWGSITIRSRFLDYTGEYVIHCHFLGHEDRGMMIGVQTVCPGQSAPVYGQAVPAGTRDDCAVTSPSAPACGTSTFVRRPVMGLLP